MKVVTVCEKGPVLPVERSTNGLMSGLPLAEVKVKEPSNEETESLVTEDAPVGVYETTVETASDELVHCEYTCEPMCKNG